MTKPGDPAGSSDAGAVYYIWPFSSSLASLSSLCLDQRATR